MVGTPIRAALFLAALLLMLTLPSIAAAVPNPASNPTATAGNAQIVLGWTNNGGAGWAGTKIYRRTSPVNAWVMVKNEPALATWTNVGLTNMTEYQYAIRATDGVTDYPTMQTGGLYAKWFDNPDLATAFGGRTVEGPVSFNAAGQQYLTSADNMSTRLDGWVYTDYNETYTWYISHDDNVTLVIDGTTLFSVGCCGENSATMAMTPGWHTVGIDFVGGGAPNNMSFSYSSPSTPKQLVPANKLAHEQEVAATPTDLGVTVTAPNGGENLTGGTTSITWSKSGTDVPSSWQIYTSTDGGLTWPNHLAGVPAGTLAYSWDIPANTYGTQYRVKVVGIGAAGNTLASDSSNANFTVSTSAPAAVDGFRATGGNGQVTLTWSNPTDTRFHHVQIWRSTTEGDPGLPVYTAPSNAVTSWTDLTAANGTTYYYTARSADSGGTVSLSPTKMGLNLSQYSGNNFGTWVSTEVSASPISPNWGNGWYSGTTSGNAPGWLAYDWFSLRWSGLFWAENPGTYTFDTAANDGARLYVDGTLVYQVWPGGNCDCGTNGTTILTRGWHTFRQDYSDSWSDTYIYSYVTGPGLARQIIPVTSTAVEPTAKATPTIDSVTVLTPNGGEQLLGDATPQISWTSTAGTGSISLWYSTDGGATFPYAIARNQPLIGTFRWTLPPSVNSSTVRVLAELHDAASGMATASDMSNANLTVDAISVAPPSAPTNVKARASTNQVTVTWNTPSPIGTYDHAVVYRSTNESDIGTVVYTAPNAATTSWVDATAVNGGTYYYRVRGATVGGRQGRQIVTGSLQRAVWYGNTFSSYMWRDVQSSNGSWNIGNGWYSGLTSELAPGVLQYDSFSVRQTGMVYIDTPGMYQFEEVANDGGRVYIDGMLIANNWPGGNCDCYNAGGVSMTAGWHDVALESQETCCDAYFNFNYAGPSIGRQQIPLAKIGYEPSVMASPSVETIAVTSPNGGEVFNGDTTLPITWTSSAGTGSVELRYSIDGGASFPIAIAISQPLNGSFVWQMPPNIVSANVRIRAILHAAGTNVPTTYDDSNADFTIDSNQAAPPPAPPSIKSVASSNSITVSWSNPSPIGTFDHAVVWRSTDERVPGAVVYTAPSSATTSWVDASAVNGTTYYYRVRGVSAAGKMSRNIITGALRKSMYSGNNFGSLLWTETPNTNIAWNIGNGWYSGFTSDQSPGTLVYDNFSQRWNGLVYADTAGLYQFESNANDGGRVTVDGVQVAASWPNGNCDCNVAGGIWLTQGWHDLVVEYQESCCDSYQYVNYAGPGIGRQAIPLTKLAYEPITAATPVADTVTVSSPNGGETFTGDAPMTISWTSTAATGTVELRYSTDGGTTYPSVIVTGQNLNGSFTWELPPDLNSATVRVRAVLHDAATNQPTRYDDSNANFTIDTGQGAPPPAPTGIAASAGAGQVTITWNNPSPMGTFDHAVVYRSTNERTLGSAVYTAPSSAVTSWNDVSATNGTTYYYRVRGSNIGGRQSRKIISGTLRRSTYSGNNFNSLVFTDLVTTNIAWNIGNGWYSGFISDQAPGTLLYDSFSQRWNGLVYADTAGMYQFESNANDGGRIFVDGVQVAAAWPNGNCDCNVAGGISLTQGWHELVVEYQESCCDSYQYINYAGPGIGRQAIPLNKLATEPIASATPTADTITVSTPNGGESLRGDTPKTITWTSTAATGTVDLRYSTDGGATFPNVIVTGQPLNGSFEWQVPPNVITATARVRAVLRAAGVGQPTRSDDSNANFTINTDQSAPPPAPTNVATSPGNGSILVTWVNPIPIGSFDHAIVYRSTNENQLGTAIYTAPNSAVTSYADNSVTNGFTYYYRVRGVDASGRVARNIVPGRLRESLFSGSNFNTYQSSDEWVGMLNPDWGSAVTSGPISYPSMQKLMWDYFSMRWTGAIYIDTAGLYQMEIEANDSGRFYIDNIPVAQSWPGSDCWCANAGGVPLTVGWHDLAVEYSDTVNNARVVINYSGPSIGRQQVPLGKLGYEPIATATPSAASVSLSAPTGGATYTTDYRPITWTTANAPIGSVVRLYYSIDGGATYDRTIAGDAGTSPYQWFLPRGINSATVRVRAELIDTSGYMIARSDSGNFTVDTLTLQPATGLTLTPGWNQTKVDWVNPVGASFDHVNIYRSTSTLTLGAKVATIAKPATTWTDNTVLNGTTYYYTVRAADAADKEVSSVEAGRIKGDYWTGANFDGILKSSQADTTSIAYDWQGGNPAVIGQGDYFSIRWSGWIYFDADAKWTIDTVDTADGVRFWLGGTKVVDNWTACDCATYDTYTLHATKGWHPFTYEMHDNNGWSRAFLYYQRAGLGRQIIPMSALGSEVQRSATPTDTTPPIPNPNGQATAISATSIIWSAPGASDPAGSGLNATAYSFDGGTTWQAPNSLTVPALTANTQYSRSVVVRDAALNQTTPKVVQARTLAVAPTVTADRATGTWLGAGAATVTFTNNAAWGAGGVQYYRYVWDTSATHTWSDSETQWSAGSLARVAGASGDWYLHLRSYNGDDVNSGNVDVGPFRIDLSPPIANPANVTVNADAVSVNFTVTGAADTESGLAATPYSFDGGTTWQAAANLSDGALGPNTTVTKTVIVRDVVGNQTTANVVSGTTLPSNPNVTASPLAGPTWRANGTVITLTSSIAFGPGTIWGYHYMVSTNATDVVSAGDPSWTSGTMPVSLVGTSANWFIHVRSYNASGVGGTTQDLGPFRIDNSGPAPVTPVPGPDPTAVAPTMSWASVTDAESGLAGYRVYRSTIPGVLGGLIGSTALTTYTDGGGLVNGQRYYYTVQGYDNLGNEQFVGNTQIGITYDSVTPTGFSVVIAGGAAYTATQAVTLTLASTNAAEMQIGNLPDVSDGTWEPFNVAKGWNLPAGDGTKTVYTRFKSGNGSISAVVSDTIVLDTTAPTPNPATGTSTIVSATAITWNASAASDTGSGLNATPYSFDNGTTWQAGASLAQTGLAPNTPYTRTLKFRDAIGNATASGVVNGTTLPAAPGVTSVPAPDGSNTQPLGQTFVFTNTATFGAGGVQFYRYVWDTVPGAHTFLGTESTWNASTLNIQEWNTGTYYLHVLAYNANSVSDQQLTMGPYMLAPPTGSQTVYSNVGTSQTLSCAKTDFSVTLLPGISDDALIDCTVTSATAGWNLQVHAAASPFFTDFLDAGAPIVAYAPPAAANSQVAFTASGAKSVAAYANGTKWRGFAGATDIKIGSDTLTSAGTVITNRIRAEMGTSASATPGARSQTVTYTLSPGP